MEAEIEDSDKQKFYEKIVKLTKIRADKEFILKCDSDNIVKIITRNYKNHIEIAALNGRNMAYLCFYKIDARIKNLIPIHDFINMSEKIRIKFEEYKLESIVDRLTKILYPFKLLIRNIQDCNELPKTEKNNIIVISVQWN
jgi:hypothetical protein